MQSDEEAVKTWLKKAKVDLHYLAVHLEEHASKAITAKLSAQTKVAAFEQDIVEMYYRRISELRSVIAEQESKLSQAKTT
jgi:hypothetical protein